MLNTGETGRIKQILESASERGLNYKKSVVADEADKTGLH